MSDLHLEIFPDPESYVVPRKAPLLLLAGDIGRLSSLEKLTAFLARQCSIFEHVYLVPGNHEYYALTREEATSRLASMTDSVQMQGKLTVLNRTRIDLNDNVTLLGCTLHSHVAAEVKDIVRAKVKDFWQIKDWDVDDHNREHARDLTWLRGEISSIAQGAPHRSIVIATHHAPSHRGMSNPDHANNAWSSAFATELVDGELMTWEGIQQVQCWVFGHTHWCSDALRHGIHFVSNQRGYVLGDKAASTDGKPWLKLPKFKRKSLSGRCFDVQKCIRVG